MSVDLREQAAVLALTRASRSEWHRTATVIYEVGSALAVLDGRLTNLAEEHRTHALALRKAVSSRDLAAAEDVIRKTTASGARLLTVLDEEYPGNLQLIYNRPPFIWTRGSLVEQDYRAIAVVGTRQASDEGIGCAARLASGLVKQGVTVLSGLARGIDTAAHGSALDAGGRTIAVMGTGISRAAYPRENAGLAMRIVENGALVSQFWPDAPPRQSNFPMRNVVMSGMAVGTVVVEASATSGAKMQARLALEHGKHVFLLESLVKSQTWAARYAERPGATVVHDVDDILEVLVRLADRPRQLSLAF